MVTGKPEKAATLLIKKQKKSQASLGGKAPGRSDLPFSL